MTEATNAIDCLRFAAARAMVALTQLRNDTASPAHAALNHLHRDLAEALCRLCPEGQDPEAHASRYSDNRPEHVRLRRHSRTDGAALSSIAAGS